MMYAALTRHSFLLIKSLNVVVCFKLMRCRDWLPQACFLRYGFTIWGVCNVG